jgi:hypothetical protein
MWATTVSAYLPAMVSALTTRLPVELVEKILTRLPLSAVLELSIVEDEMARQSTEQKRADGFISRCILGSLGWKPVFPNRTTLLNLRDLFTLMSEAYQLVYRRPFSHAIVRRERIGISEAKFRPLQSVLSMHTRYLGPAHKVLLPQYLLRKLSQEYGRFICEVWYSMAQEWPTYVSHAPDITLEDVHIQAVVCGRSQPWFYSWVDVTDDADVLLVKLRYMVSVERAYRKKMGSQLKHHSSLLGQHPKRLKKLGDYNEQPRPNIQHVIDRLDQDARDIANLHFAARRKNKGGARFRQAHLPIIPLDKWMWFFLDCRARILSGSNPSLTGLNLSQPMLNFPPALIDDMETVMDGMHIFRGAQGSNFPMKTSRIPRLVFRNEDRENPPLGQLSTQNLEERLLDGRERRPVFTARRKLYSANGLGAPHDKREIQWLDVFCRCCERLSGIFPDILAQVEQEAKKDYLPCPIAEAREKERAKRKSATQIAANMALKSAKWALLTTIN